MTEAMLFFLLFLAGFVAFVFAAFHATARVNLVAAGWRAGSCRP